MNFYDLRESSSEEQRKQLMGMSADDRQRFAQFNKIEDAIDVRLKEKGMVSYDELSTNLEAHPVYKRISDPQERVMAYFNDPLYSQEMRAFDWRTFPAPQPSGLSWFKDFPEKLAQLSVSAGTGMITTMSEKRFEQAKDVSSFWTKDVERAKRDIVKYQEAQDRLQRQIEKINEGEAEGNAEKLQEKIDKIQPRKERAYNTILKMGPVAHALKANEKPTFENLLDDMATYRQEFMQKFEDADPEAAMEMKARQLWAEQNPISWSAIAKDPLTWMGKGVSDAAPSLAAITVSQLFAGPTAAMGTAVGMETGGYYASHTDELMQKTAVPYSVYKKQKERYLQMAERFHSEYVDEYGDDPAVVAQQMLDNDYEVDSKGNVWLKRLSAAEAHEVVVGSAKLYGAISGVLEYLPMGRAFNVMGKGVKHSVMKMAGRNVRAMMTAKKFFGSAGLSAIKFQATQGLLEGTTEMLQRTAEMVIESGEVNFQKILDDEEFWQSGWAGLMAGLVMGGMSAGSVYKKMKMYQRDDALKDQVADIENRLQRGEISKEEATKEFDAVILERSKNWIQDVRDTGNKSLLEKVQAIWKKAPEVKITQKDKDLTNADLFAAKVNIVKNLQLLEADKKTDKEIVKDLNKRFNDLLQEEEVVIDDVVDFNEEVVDVANEDVFSRVQESDPDLVAELFPDIVESEIHKEEKEEEAAKEIVPVDERSKREVVSAEMTYAEELVGDKGVTRVKRRPHKKYELETHKFEQQEKQDSGEKILEFIAYKKDAKYFEKNTDNSKQSDKKIANFLEAKLGMKASDTQIQQLKDMYARGFFPNGLSTISDIRQGGKKLNLDKQQQREFLEWYAGDTTDMSDAAKQHQIVLLQSNFGTQFDARDTFNAFDMSAPMPTAEDMTQQMIDQFVQQEQQTQQEDMQVEAPEEASGIVGEWQNKVAKSQVEAAKELVKKSGTELQEIINTFQEAGYDLDFSKAPHTSAGKLNWGKKKQVVGALVYNIAQVNKAQQPIVTTPSEVAKQEQPKPIEIAEQKAQPVAQEQAVSEKAEQQSIPTSIPEDVFQAALKQKAQATGKPAQKPGKKTTTDDVSGLDEFQETLEAPAQTIIGDPKTYNKVLKRLQKQMPFVTSLNGEFIVNEISTNPNAVGRALGRGVEWTKEAGLETPPHEYFHIYWGMMEGTPIQKRAMKIIGKDAKGTEEALALYAGKYYVDRATAGVPKKVAMWFRQFWAKVKKVFAPSKLTEENIKEIIASEFYTAKVKAPTKVSMVARHHDPSTEENLGEYHQTEIDFGDEDGGQNDTRHEDRTDNAKEIRISLLHHKFTKILNRYLSAEEFNELLSSATDPELEGFNDWKNWLEDYYEKGTRYENPWTTQEMNDAKIMWQKMQSKVERADIKFIDLINIDADGKVTGKKMFRPNNGYDPKTGRYLGKYWVQDFVGEDGIVDNLYYLPLKHMLKAVNKKGEALARTQEEGAEDKKPFWLFKDSKSVTVGTVKGWDTSFSQRYFEMEGKTPLKAFFAPKGGDASFMFFIRISDEDVIRGSEEKNWTEYWNNEIANGRINDDMFKEIKAYYKKNVKSNPMVMAQIIGRHETWKKIKWNNYAVEAKSMQEMFDRLKLDFAQGVTPRGIGNIKTVSIDPKNIIVTADNVDVTDNLFFEGRYIGDGWIPASGGLLNRIAQVLGRGKLPVLKTVQRDRDAEGENYLNMKGLLGVIQSGLKFYVKNEDGSRGRAILRTGLKQEGAKWVVSMEYKNSQHKWEEIDMIGTSDEIKQKSGDKYSAINEMFELPETAMRILQIPPRESKTSATFPIQWSSMLADPQMRAENLESIQVVEQYLGDIADIYWKRLLNLRQPDKKGKYSYIYNELYRAIHENEVPGQIDRYIEKLGISPALLHPILSGRTLMEVRNRLIVDGAFTGRRLGSGTLAYFKPDMKGEVQKGNIVVSADNNKVFSKVLSQFKKTDLYVKEEFDVLGFKEKVNLLNDYLANNTVEVMLHRVPVLDIYGSQIRRIQKLELGYQGDVAFMTHDDVFNVFQADHDGDKININFLPSPVVKAIKDISQSKIYQQKKRITRLSIFKHKDTTSSVLDPEEYIRMASIIAIADGSQGVLANAKSQFLAVAQKELQVALGDNKSWFSYKVRNTEEQMVFEEGVLDNNELLENPELLEEIYNRGDRITDGDINGFDTVEEAIEFLETGEKALLVTTPDHILSIWLQASVDNAKEMLLPLWKYEGKQSIMKYIFEKTSDSKYFHSKELSHLLTQFNVSNLRRGETQDQMHLHTTDLISESEKLSDLINMTPEDIGTHIQAQYHETAPRSQYGNMKVLPVHKIKVNGEATSLEKTLASLWERIEEQFTDNPQILTEWGGSPITFNNRTIFHAHYMALTELSQGDMVRGLKKNMSQDDILLGRRTGAYLAKKFRGIMEARAESQKERDSNVNLVTYDFHEEIQKMIDDLYERFNKLSPEVQAISTLYFLQGAAVRVNTVKGKKIANVKEVIQLLPLDLMSEDIVMPYLQMWGEHLIKPLAEKIADNVPQSEDARYEELQFIKEAKKHDQKECP